MSTPTDPQTSGPSQQDPQAAYDAATVSISTEDARRLMEQAGQEPAAGATDQVPEAAPVPVVDAVEQVPPSETTPAPEVTSWDDASQETVTVDQGAWRAATAEASTVAADGVAAVPAPEATGSSAYGSGEALAYGSAQSPSFAAPAGGAAAAPDPFVQQQVYTQPGYGQDQQAYNQQAYAQPGTQQAGYAYAQGAQQGAYAAPGYGAPAYAGQPVYGQKSKMAAGLLGIFLGSLGVHNFYLGYTGKAMAQLLITLLTFGIGAMVTGVWGLVEGILILTAQPGAPTWGVDAKGVPLSS